MKISVLIAAHRAGDRIARALESVRSQLHHEWEVLVVEYGSPDQTRSIVRQFGATADRPVHYLNLGENHGPASARNRLLELATADFVAFLEPSDEWTPRHLDYATAHLADGADIVVSDVSVGVDSAGRPSPEVRAPSALVTNPARTVFARDVVAVSAVAFRRDLTRRVGLFDTRFRAMETRDYWFRSAIAQARFSVTQRVTCHSRRHDHHEPGWTLLNAEQSVQFYEKHRDAAIVPAALRRRFLSSSLVTHGRLLRGTDPTRAARCFWRAWSLQPVHVQTLGQFALAGWRSPEPPPPLASSFDARRQPTPITESGSP